MSVFIVTYDLMAPGKDYSRLWARLAEWRAVRGLESVWFIETQSIATVIRDDLRGYIDANDRLFVGVLSGQTAWTTMRQGAGEFLHARFAMT
jgi:hypothetical protein